MAAKRPMRERLRTWRRSLRDPLRGGKSATHWIPAQWRELHELYEFARMRGWQREPLSFGAGAFSQPSRSLEQEFVRALLLMRLGSGNFTPDQVEWVARSLD